MGYVGHGSQKTFAEFIGVTPDRWHDVESGPQSSSLLLVAKCPGMTLDWLFLGRTGGLTLDMFKRLEGVYRS